ncbi:TonB-dependent receptor family protein [Isoalcanivorax indicus]|uniref:TonB-dependent receptor family protein n=1 Tax=Isoalcanivorax indicus TaxID=2202653 RepID=UPI000DB922FF|nr:TonB-dependent receptor [Isoalcanivorax indicus]
MHQKKLLALAIACMPVMVSADTVEQGQAAQTQRQAVLLPQIDVVGRSEEDVSRQPGAVSLVTREEMDLVQPRSTEDALRRVPGVYIKREEESAIVANIGIRGLSSNDYKTLVLEDGVPIAPGLFVGNGRYYNPRIQRINDIEVLKGAASLRYGPSTIGGVINYRTKQPEDGLAVEASAGSWNTFGATVEIGGSAPSGDGIFGAVLSRVESDGFMDKGYEMTDAMIKAGTAIGDTQWLGIKFSRHENDANISYRGLFLGEYKDGATNNPAPDDYYLTDRTSFDINHFWEISADASLKTLVYWSQMNRDYWRYRVNAADSAAEGSWVYTDNVDGNNRAFERFGVETRLTVTNNLFGMPGEAEVGLRYMNEEMHDRTVLAVRSAPRTPNAARGGFGRDRIDTADSYALFAQNRFGVTERLAVTPGVRVEYYEQSRENLQNTTSVSTSNTEVMPGVGATFDLLPTLQFFGGVYRAFAPALNGDALDGMQDQDLDAERSVNVEVGVRGRNDRLTYEATAFRMDFRNQVIPANSNTNFQTTNAGKTMHQGIEAAAGLDLGAGFSLVSNVTWIADAEFVGDRFAWDDDLSQDVLTAPDGNRVPFTPEWIANVSLGYEVGNLKTLLSANYTGSQFTDEMNTLNIQENTSGFFTGKIGPQRTMDLSTRYAISGNLELFGAIKNLTDERYIASLRQGIYVGPERSYEAGFRYQF